VSNVRIHLEDVVSHSLIPLDIVAIRLLLFAKMGVVLNSGAQKSFTIFEVLASTEQTSPSGEPTIKRSSGKKLCQRTCCKFYKKWAITSFSNFMAGLGVCDIRVFQLRILCKTKNPFHSRLSAGCVRSEAIFEGQSLLLLLTVDSAIPSLGSILRIVSENGRIGKTLGLQTWDKVGTVVGEEAWKECENVVKGVTLTQLTNSFITSLH
jgi:hypothetical protein